VNNEYIEIITKNIMLATNESNIDIGYEQKIFRQWPKKKLNI